MEKITFSTVLGTAVTIDDVNTSSDADGYIPLHLLKLLLKRNKAGVFEPVAQKLGQGTQRVRDFVVIGQFFQDHPVDRG